MIGRIGPTEIIITTVILLCNGLIPIGSLVFMVLIYLKLKRIEEILEKDTPETEA